MSTSPLHNSASSGSPLEENVQKLIPTTHALLSEEHVAGLNEWIDSDLARLEQQFENFVTPQSLRKSLRRR